MTKLRIIPSDDWQIILDGRRLKIVCPECKTPGTTYEHDIKEDGSVHPSLICGCCGYHEYVKLQGWDGGNKSFPTPVKI